MDFEELTERYKGLQLWVRLVIGAILGLIPSYYIYTDNGEVLEEQIDQVRSENEVMQVKFERERKKKSKLPELQSRLAFTEQQLKESSKRLPPDFLMNVVLQDSAIIARDTGVDLRVFDPGSEIPGKEAFKYMELPIQLELRGRFQEIASFIDRIVNMEKMVHIRNMSLQPVAAEAKETEEKVETAEVVSPETMQRHARENLKLAATVSMVIYRAMSVVEEQNSLAPEEDKKGKTKPKRNKNITRNKLPVKGNLVKSSIGSEAKM